MPSREDAISGGGKPRRTDPREIRIHAPAKINLILKVLDPRPDGFHNLWSLMQTVAVEDELRCRPDPESRQVQLSIEGADLPADDRNLVTRAARLVLERAGRAEGLRIHLRKSLPAGGGLGGGSSDAAATLLALNDLLGLAWTGDELRALGERLGSDVPFFFSAPSAVVEGRGEVVRPVRLRGERWVLLVAPPVQVSTGWAFAHLAAARASVPPLPRRIQALGARTELSWEEVEDCLENDFEAALDAAHPAFREIKHRLLAAGARGALLSGSGSTVYGLFRSEQEATLARAGLEGRGYWLACGRACAGPLRAEAPNPSPRQPVC